MVSLLILPVATYGADWSQWELENAVAKERDWLVIRQPPEGFCYLKQSYTSDPSKMEMTTGRSGVPTIITPFFKGVQGSVRYQVDNNTPREIPVSQLEHPSVIELPRDLVPVLKAGQQLTVRVTPIGESPRTQTFSLLGFTAASRWLEREECKFKVSKQATGEAGDTALDVRLERIAEGKVQIVGETSLPNGMQLMLDLVNTSADYFAQDKVVISAGTFRSAAFSSRGAALPAGTYEVSVSSPLPSLQPASVRSAVGENGELLSGPAVVEEGGKRRIHWTVQRQLE
jgi:hypothetical protein